MVSLGLLTRSTRRACLTTISSPHWRPRSTWQIAKWTSRIAPEGRSSSPMRRPYRAAESESVPATRINLQGLLLSRMSSRSSGGAYWPIDEAAQEIGLPVACTPSASRIRSRLGLARVSTRDMVGHSQCQQTALASLVSKACSIALPTSRW